MNKFFKLFLLLIACNFTNLFCDNSFLVFKNLSGYKIEITVKYCFLSEIKEGLRCPLQFRNLQEFSNYSGTAILDFRDEYNSITYSIKNGDVLRPKPYCVWNLKNGNLAITESALLFFKIYNYSFVDLIVSTLDKNVNYELRFDFGLGLKIIDCNQRFEHVLQFSDHD